MTQKPSRAVHAQARRWFVRLLDDDVPAEEIAEWEAWLAADSAHRIAYDDACDAWGAGGEVAAARPAIPDLTADSYDGTISVAEHVRKASTPRFSRLAAPLLAAGLTVAVIGGGLLFAQWRATPPAEAITTARAEHKTAALPDGSAIKLAAMTGVEVRLSETKRAIRLDRGEAYFNVAHDKTRPFVVQTPFGEITAVGTQFNIDVGADHMALTVTEGAVVVRPGQDGLLSLAALASGPVKVKAGQRWVVHRGALQNAARVESGPTRVAWLDRRLEYRGELLRVVVEDVNRYAEHPVLIADEALGDMRYTGTVDLDAVDAWAEGLPAAFPAAILRREENSLVLAKKM